MKHPVHIVGIASLLFAAVLMGGLGSLYLLDPAAVREAAGISPQTPAALAEIRSTYGGLHVGISIFLLGCAVVESRRRVGLLLCALVFLSAGAARIFGVLKFGVRETSQPVVALLECLFGGLTIFLYRRWPAS